MINDIEWDIPLKFVYLACYTQVNYFRTYCVQGFVQTHHVILQNQVYNKLQIDTIDGRLPVIKTKTYVPMTTTNTHNIFKRIRQISIVQK